jgi:hypothetical protein
MRKTIIVLGLGASVLLRLDPVELVVYLEGPPTGTSVNEIVAEAACPYVGAQQVPLPVPYTVRVFQRSGESQRYVPQYSPIAKGVLSKCPARIHGIALE